MTGMRVVIDSNVWLSALISTHVRSQLQAIMADSAIQILSNHQLFSEIKEVMQRPKFRRYFSTEIAIEFSEIIRNRVDFIESNSRINVCRDPEDDFVLALCYDAEADYLLTGDQDLLVLDPFEGIRIVTIQQFISIFSQP